MFNASSLNQTHSNPDNIDQTSDIKGDSSPSSRIWLTDATWDDTIAKNYPRATFYTAIDDQNHNTHAGITNPHTGRMPILTHDAHVDMISPDSLADYQAAFVGLDSKPHAFRAIYYVPFGSSKYTERIKAVEE